MRTVKHNFSRICPVCSKIIWYNSKSSLNRATLAGNKPCQSCFISSLWGAGAPLRKEETRLKRNNSIAKARADLTSAYHTQEYIEKQSSSHKKLWDDPNSIYNSGQSRQNKSVASILMWQTQEYRIKRLSLETMVLVAEKSAKWMTENYSQFIESLKLSWTDDRKKRAKERFLKLLDSDEFKEKLWGKQQSIRVSKLELKIKDQLEKFGYQHSSIHKKYFGRYLPDFLNENHKTIIEVYGDYWHCNPLHKIFGNPEWYHPKLKMISSDKWASDFLRNTYLEKQGYKMIILWESDIKNANYDCSLLLPL